MQKLILVFILFFNLPFNLPEAFSQVGRVGFNHEKWVTTSSEHFHIVHSAQHQDLGLYYSRLAEEAYTNLSTIFKKMPPQVTIIINDNTDTSNGYATVIPYPLIMIYPVQIGNEESLSEAGEWARELLTHELTHIVQLYPSGGFYDYIRPVFGSIVSPNLLMPNWWKEGMAVEIETQFSNQGRVRSNLQNAHIRSLVAENKFGEFTLAQANEALMTWPFGSRPYFFGSLLMSEIAIDGKSEALNHIVTEQSERVPYAVEKPMRDYLGQTYQSEYSKMIDQFTAIAEQEIRTLEQKKMTPVEVIAPDLLLSRNPRLHLPTQTLGLIGVDKKGPKLFFFVFDKILNKYVEHPVYKPIKGEFGSFEFHPTENKIIYNKVDAKNSKQEFSDLYLYDLDLKKETPVTEMARAREPQFSPLGDQVLYISTENGLTHLKLFNLQKKDLTLLFETPYQSRITTALFVSEFEVLVNIRNSLGDQELRLLDLKSGAQEKVSTPYKQIRFIRKIKDSLYFTSTQNGVSNIYETSAGPGRFKKSKPVSHFLAGSLSFDLQSDEKIISTQIGASGLYVGLSEKYYSHRSNDLPVISSAVLKRYQYTEKPLPETTTKTEDYGIKNYIWPKYWIPFISSNSNNKGIVFSATTSGHDPLNIHAYEASVNYDTYFKKVGFDFDYINSAANWPITVSALQTQTNFGTSDYFIQKNTYSLGVLPDSFSIHKNLTTSLGFVYKNTDDDINQTNHSGGYAQAAYKSYEQKIYQYYPMSGWGAILRYENLKAINNNFLLYDDYSQVLTSVLGFTSFLLPVDHALMLKVDGLYTVEKVSNRFGFSNSSFALTSNSVVPQFLIRGYTGGQFFGNRIVTANLEYRFPIKDINNGNGTDPFFFKSLTAAVVADGIAVQGFAETRTQTLVATKLTDQYYSAGIEARLGTTIGFILPLNVVLGWYLPFSPEFADSAQTGISFQLGGL